MEAEESRSAPVYPATSAIISPAVSRKLRIPIYKRDRMKLMATREGLRGRGPSR